MDQTKRIKVYLYTRYERFWHWLQAAIIIFLMITGFEIHGTYTLMGYETAVKTHNFVGLSWLVLFAFFVFWLIHHRGGGVNTFPQPKNSLMWRYTMHPEFSGANPIRLKNQSGAKHNPLQRLTYLALSALMLPVQMVSGMLYYTWNLWGGVAWSLAPVALIHTLLAFLLLSFLVIHVYMTTTGHSMFSHITGMITGWEEISETTTIQDWEVADKRRF